MLLTDAEILKMGRGDVKYALFRTRGGSAEAEHHAVHEYYKARLEKYGLDIHLFGSQWDLDKGDHRNIVSGHIVRVYGEELDDITDLEGKAVPKAPPQTQAQIAVADPEVPVKAKNSMSKGLLAKLGKNKH